MSEFPEKWISTNFMDIFDIHGGTQPPKSTFQYEPQPGYVRLLQIRDFGERPVPTYVSDTGALRKCVEQDILVARYGASLGRILTGLSGAYNVAIAKVNIPETIDKRFVYYLLRSEIFQAPLRLLSRSAQNGFNKQDLEELQIPLAPLNEQKRIADKLDRLLAKVDACRERCDRIPLILKRFRQSVLAAATSGELTEDWREQHRSLAEWEPSVFISEELNSAYGSLPVGWKWKLIREVGRVQLGRQRAPKYHSGQYMRPYLRVQNIFEDRIDLSDVMEMDFSPDDFERYQLHFGDILLNEGQSPVFLGRPAMYRDDLPGACFTNSLIRFRAFDIVNSDFALLVFRHYMHCGRFREESTITTNIAHLSAGRFSNIEFPLAPIEEQQEIVRRVEKLFAFADRLESRYQNARTKCDQLTPALLEKAFQGELVPQDPNDEPASVLLERIKSLRSNAETNQTKSQRRKTAPEKPYRFKVKMLTRKEIQPSHLSDILKASGSLTAEALWTASQLETDDFYDQLKDEEAQNLLKETRAAENSGAFRLLEAA